MTMERTIFMIVVHTAVYGTIGKHVYVPDKKKWTDAQNYCRKHYTDLSPINSERDEARLREASAGHHYRGWIGLHREPSNLTGWKWSGGGYTTYQNWASGQPNNHNGVEYFVICTKDGWVDSSLRRCVPFFCLNLVVVEEKKSWEEALQYCREDHTELTSLVSETELLLAQREIQEAQTTERVWIGLRYLGDRWLWVNREPLEYQAWPQGGDQDHLCPTWSHSCGALTKEGLWENWDCQEKLNFICY